MKKFADIFLVFLLVVCAVFSSYLVSEKAVKHDRSSAVQTTATKLAVTEKGSDRILLVENNKRDYHFYKQDNDVVMVHNGVEYTFENWSSYIDVEKPKLYFRQLDKDEPLEMIIKLVSDVNDDGTYVYGVYVINEIAREDGTIKYTVNAMTRSTTKQIIDDKVNIEISQSPVCKKIGYVALYYVYNEMEYDRETGVPQGYYRSFKTLQDENGDYLTVDTWERGAAEYTVEDNGIFVSFPITIKYKNTDVVQDAGYVKCMLSVSSTNQTYVVNKTMTFKPNMEYGAYNYDYDDKEWKSVCKNANSSTGGDKVIDYIQYDMEVKSDLDTDDFSKNTSDLNKLSKITVQQDGVVLYAKQGFKFKKSLIKSNEFSVPMTITDGESNNFDVSYMATLSHSSNGAEILTVKFDQPYKRDNIDKIKINFGVR